MSGGWRDKAAGLMCVGMPSSALDDQTRALLDAGVAGVLLHRSRLPSPDDVAHLSQAIKNYAGRPIFVAADHEVLRSEGRGGFTPLPLACELGATNDLELARNVGQVLGRELRAVGVDMTIGPTIDVASPGVGGLTPRSLGCDPEQVSRLGAALIEAQQAEGVAACAQYFPIPGDELEDPNASIPALSHTIARLEEVELRPFLAAVRARVSAMMVSHVFLSELDAEFPASLSRPIIFGLLRQKLGYRGLLMIDDVDRLPFGRRFSHETVAIRGIASGADCFLCASHPMTALSLMSTMDRAIQDGAVMPERLEAARRRVAQVIHRYVQGPGPASELTRIFGDPLLLDEKNFGPLATRRRDSGFI
jgi:beta-N-acetylhexosaminidase